MVETPQGLEASFLEERTPSPKGRCQTERERMKRYKFILDDNSVYDVIARTFRDACIAFEQFGIPGKQIKLMECYE
jgi:hypothetical protein